MNYLGLNKEKTNLVVRELNLLLSNYHVYYQNLRNFHWNVKGENFFELHEQFENLYNDAKEKIDDVAERILTLRHSPISQFTKYLDTADVQESPILDDDREMVSAILKDHFIIIANMRKLIEVADDASDEGTIDLIGSALEGLEKESWMLDAWLAKKQKSATVNQ